MEMNQDDLASPADEAQLISDFRASSTNPADLLMSDEEVLQRLRGEDEPVVEPPCSSLQDAGSNEDKVATPPVVVTPVETRPRRCLARLPRTGVALDEAYSARHAWRMHSSSSRCMHVIERDAEENLVPIDLTTVDPGSHVFNLCSELYLDDADPDTVNVRFNISHFEKFLWTYPEFAHRHENRNTDIASARSITSSETRLAYFHEWRATNHCRKFTRLEDYALQDDVLNRIEAALVRGLSFQQIWDYSLPWGYNARGERIGVYKSFYRDPPAWA